MSAPAKIIVHTDIILDYLNHAGMEQHLLRRAMRKCFCYTTVFNAIELFSLAITDDERIAIEHAVSSMKILGLNAKHARRYGEWLGQGKTLPRMNGLIACMSLESKVPILTGQPDEFCGMDGLTLLAPSDI